MQGRIRRVALPPPGSKDDIKSRASNPSGKEPRQDQDFQAYDDVENRKNGVAAGVRKAAIAQIYGKPLSRQQQQRPSNGDRVLPSIGGPRVGGLIIPSANAGRAAGWGWAGGGMMVQREDGRGGGGGGGGRGRVWSAAPGGRRRLESAGSVMRLQPEDLAELCGDLDDELGKIDDDSESEREQAQRRAAPPSEVVKRQTPSARRLVMGRGGGGGGGRLKRPLNSAPTLGRNSGAQHEQGLDGLLPGGIYIPRGALGGRDMGVIGMGRYEELEANVEAKQKRVGGRKQGGFFAQPPPSRASGGGPIASRFVIPRYRGEMVQGSDRAWEGACARGGVDLVDDLEGLPAEIAAARLRRRHQCKHYAGFQLICQGIYLGPASVSQMLAPLQDAGITHVLNVTDTEPCAFPQHFKYFTVPVQDTSTERLEPYFAAAFSFLSRAVAGGGKVYVHCVQGVSRSTSMVLYFMMRSLDMSLLDAFKQASDARACAHPNINFWGQLAREEVKLRGQCSCSVHQYQVRMLHSAFPGFEPSQVGAALEKAGWDSAEAAKLLGESRSDKH